MDYSIDLFAETQDDSITHYRTEFAGAFYSVFVDAENGFHMAEEDKESLLERIRFYENDIAGHPYLIYTQRFGSSLVRGTDPDAFRQAIGLPESVMTTLDPLTQEKKLLSSAEILNRISFEKGLKISYGNLINATSEVLKANDPSVIGAVNFLIENGFFFQNPEVVLAPCEESKDPMYPVYIDDSKVPGWLIPEKETGDKLFMDFADEILTIDRNSYLTAFRKNDSLSLNEMADYAFNQNPQGLSPAELLYRKALRRYLCALVRKLLNSFYGREYHLTFLFGHTAISHDLYSMRNDCRYVYYGTNFNMYSLSYRHFSKDGDQVKENMNPTQYALDSLDKPGITRAFTTTQQYFRRHPELGFVPTVFLRTMGLPYPAFTATAFFDFEKGTVDEFLSLLPFHDALDFETDGIILPLLNEQGMQRPTSDWQNYDAFYLRAMEREGLFLSSFDSFQDANGRPYLFFYEGQDPRWLALLSGDVSFYRKALESIEKGQATSGKSTESFNAIEAFLAKDDDASGKYPTIRLFFDALQKGMTSYEAYKTLGLTDAVLSFSELSAIVFFARLSFFVEAGEAAFHEIDSLLPKSLLRMNRGETFDDPYLPLPHVFKGRNFIGYAGDDGVIYLDSSDNSAVTNLHRIFRRFFLSESSFPYLIDIYDEEYVYDYLHTDCHDYQTEALFLGLPDPLIKTLDLDQDIVSQLHFQDDIGIIRRKDHQQVSHDDISLSMMAVFSESLRQGVFLLGRSKVLHPFYALKEVIDEKIRMYLSPDFMKIWLDTFQKKLLETDGLPDSATKDIQKLIASEDDDFRDDFHSFALGLRPRSEATTPYLKTSSQLALLYSGYLSRSCFLFIYHSFFNELSKARHFLVSYPHDFPTISLLVSPGPSFFAFSCEEKLTSYYLLKEDKEAFHTALDAVKRLHHGFGRKQEKARQMATDLGLPVAFVERAYRLFSYLPNPSEDELAKMFGFIPKEGIDTSHLASYSDPTRTVLPENIAIFSSTQLVSSCLRDGFYIFPQVNLLDGMAFEDTPEKLQQNRVAIAAMHVYVGSDLKDIVASTLRPTPVYFTTLLKGFIEDDGKEQYDSSFGFFEVIEHAYQNNPDFLITAINLLQCEPNDKKYVAFVTKSMKGFRLEGYEKHIPLPYLCDRLALFLLDLETMIVLTVGKKLQD